jgi:AcrR family transcriptional regulator
LAKVVVEQAQTAPTGGAETRRRIMVVALELFAAQGYAGTSIRDITDRMGLTKAALYYHFESKEQILDAVTEPLRADFSALDEMAGRHPVPPAEEILARLVDILSRRVALIRTVMADPTAHPRHHPSSEVKEHLDRLAAALAADSSGPALVRARCALGAAQFGAFATASSAAAADPERARPPDAVRTERIFAGSEHLLSVDERTEIVAAALRALG